MLHIIDQVSGRRTRYTWVGQWWLACRGWSMDPPSSDPYQPSASGDHPRSSSSGSSWNYSVDNSNQNAAYYDPQRDVSVSGSTQNVTNGVPHVIQPVMGTTNATNTYAHYSNSVQPGYNAAQYPSYYYPQSANSSSVQQGVNQSSDCARICYQQLLLSKQCLGWRKFWRYSCPNLSDLHPVRY